MGALTAEKLNAPAPVARTSIEMLEHEVAEAEAALEAAEDLKRRTSPEFLAIQVELKEARLAELRETEEDARQTLKLELSASEDRYADLLQARYDAHVALCDIADALAKENSYRMPRRSKAYRAGLTVKENDSFNLRCAGRGGDTVAWAARTLQDRIARLPKAW